MHVGPFARELKIACDLALAAGDIAMRHYAGPLQVEYKNGDPSNPVTRADQEANALIVAGLAAAFPADGILAEESTDGPERHGRARLWCVDPIDGTREFVAKNGQFIVMIGLAIEGEATLGVLYHPPERRLFWGVGDAAWSQVGTAPPQRLAISAQDELSAATVAVSRSRPSRAVQQILDGLGVSHCRPIGSVGLKIAALATGAVDLYVTAATQMCEWDACAPEAVLRAAGGTVTDVCGARLLYNKVDPVTPRGIVASNGLLHARCLAALRPLAQARGWP